ncbi:helix-turn-helix domain-containing protein [Desulfosporosinus sp. SB140]|uniref:helix-turn-helix domain-containing protein n=1 Tax=Desulfosporosinus paludis TaxID=3115649 RepID=UPI00388E01B5
MGESNVNAEREQLLRQFDAGQHLKQLRGDRPLSEISKLMNVSKGYLSEVERGIRLPSDHFIGEIAKVYNTDVDDLFFRWGKIPILSYHVIAENKKLAKTIAEISRRKGLTDEQKERLCDSIHKAYKEVIDEIEAEKK